MPTFEILPCGILALPDNTTPYHIEADSSNFATGAVLSQQSPEDRKWHLVTFLSKSLSPVERDYEIHDKEMLAIVWALEEWRHFLEGVEHQVEILTDHKNLEYFMMAKKLNRRQAWWSLLLARLLNMKKIRRKGCRRLRSNCRETHWDWDSGMSQT